MITYKNITDVEVLNEMPEGATALINDGGELKQVACKEMGGSAGGGGIFEMLATELPDGGWVRDKTFKECWEAYKEGKTLRVKAKFTGRTPFPVILTPIVAEYDEEYGGYFEFNSYGHTGENNDQYEALFFLYHDNEDDPYAFNLFRWYAL